MAIDKDTSIMVTLAMSAGALILKGYQTISGKKKEVAQTGKISIETRVLNETEQRDKDKFCEEQLTNLENRYRELQSENSELRRLLKEITGKLDEAEKKTNEALNDITFLRIELAAYKQ